MKHLLFGIFENSDDTHAIFSELVKEGINGTVIQTTSIKHILNACHEEKQFITLRHLDNAFYEDNNTFYTVLDEEQLKVAQDIIRKETDNFKKVKGGMFVIPLESYEGTF